MTIHNPAWTHSIHASTHNDVRFHVPYIPAIITNTRYWGICERREGKKYVLNIGITTCGHYGDVTPCIIGGRRLRQRYAPWSTRTLSYTSVRDAVRGAWPSWLPQIFIYCLLTVVVFGCQDQRTSLLKHIRSEITVRLLSTLECRDVKVSRPAWSRDHFFGLNLGLTVIGLGLGLDFMR